MRSAKKYKVGNEYDWYRYLLFFELDNLKQYFWLCKNKHKYTDSDNDDSLPF